MEGRKKMEEFYRKLKVGTKLKYAFTTVIVTLAIAVVVSLVSIVKMNVDTYKFYKEAYANSTLQMEIRKDIQLVGKYILWSMTTDDTGSTQSYLNSAQKYADQVGKNVTTLKKSFHDKKKVAELKDAIEELKKQRVALMELAQDQRQERVAERVQEGEMHDACTAVVEFDLLFRQRELADHAVDVEQEFLPGLRQIRGAAMAFKQGDAELLLQFLDGSRKSRLRDGHLFGCLREVTALGHRLEVLQLCQFHFVPRFLHIVHNYFRL